MLETIDDYPWNLMHFRAPASRTVFCPVCRAELGGWLPYVGLKGLAPAVSTKELPAQIYLSASCSWLVRSSPFISSLDQTSVHQSAS